MVIDYKLGKIITCNVGDSRAVIMDKEAILLQTIDHNLDDNKEESKRVRSSGGRIERTNPSIPTEPLRIWLGDYPFPGLCMSRSFGKTIPSQ